MLHKVNPMNNGIEKLADVVMDEREALILSQQEFFDKILLYSDSNPAPPVVRLLKERKEKYSGNEISVGVKDSTRIVIDVKDKNTYFNLCKPSIEDEKYYWVKMDVANIRKLRLILLATGAFNEGSYLRQDMEVPQLAHLMWEQFQALSDGLKINSDLYFNQLEQIRTSYQKYIQTTLHTLDTLHSTMGAVYRKYAPTPSVYDELSSTLFANNQETNIREPETSEETSFSTENASSYRRMLEMESATPVPNYDSSLPPSSWEPLISKCLSGPEPNIPDQSIEAPLPQTIPIELGRSLLLDETHFFSQRDFLRNVATNYESLNDVISVQFQSGNEKYLYAKDKVRITIFKLPLYLHRKNSQVQSGDWYSIKKNDNLRQLHVLLNIANIDWEGDDYCSIRAKLEAVVTNERKKRALPPAKVQKLHPEQTLGRMQSDFYHVASPRTEEDADWLLEELEYSEVVVPLIWDNYWGFQYEKGPFNPGMHQRVSVTSRGFAAVGALGPEEKFLDCEGWRREGKVPVVTIGVSKVSVLQSSYFEPGKLLAEKAQPKISADGSMAIISCECAGMGVCLKWEDVLENDLVAYVIGSPLESIASENTEDCIEVACWIAPTTMSKSPVPLLFPQVQELEMLTIVPGEPVPNQATRDSCLEALRNDTMQIQNKLQDTNNKVEELQEMAEKSFHKILQSLEEHQKSAPQTSPTASMESISVEPLKPPGLYSCSNWSSIADYVFDLQDLSILDLSRNKLQDIPGAISSLKNLSSLDLSGNPLGSIPVTLCSLRSLRTLDLSRTSITAIPGFLSDLISLKTLNFSNNSISVIADEFFDLSDLQHLNFSHNELTKIPPRVESLKKLEILLFSHNHILSVPYKTIKMLVNMPALKKLDISNNKTVHQFNQGEEYIQFAKVKAELFKAVQDPNAKSCCVVCKKSIGLLQARHFCRVCGKNIHYGCTAQLVKEVGHAGNVNGRICNSAECKSQVDQ